MLDGELVEIQVREKAGEDPLSSKDKKTAEDFIHKYYPNIINKWIKFFVLKQAIKSTTINNQNLTMSRLFVTSATDVGNLTINVAFSDATSREVNIGDYILRHPHPQYNKYLDPKKFRRFSIENGNVVWGKNWDLMFPVEQLHAGVIS